MRQTPFTKKHIALGVRMAEFAGYEMPISYKGIKSGTRAKEPAASKAETANLPWKEKSRSR